MYFCNSKRDNISAVLKNYILKYCKNLDIFQIIQNSWNSSISAKDIAWNNVSNSCLYEVTEASNRTSVYFTKKNQESRRQDYSVLLWWTSNIFNFNHAARIINWNNCKDTPEKK